VQGGSFSIQFVENLKAFLKDFVAWHAKRITGDEKGQAQIFRSS
jgi:hypothetical protein